MAIDLVDHNPMLKKPVACVLGLFAENETLDRGTLETNAAQAWSDTYSQAPATVIEILVRNGALVEQLTVDGEPYGGTLEDIQRDESIPLEADVVDSISLTQAGRDLAAAIDPDFTMRQLLSDRPHYRAVFARVLAACAAQSGASREAVEAAVEAEGNVSSPEGKRVYPQYFMDALETAGGIEWDGAWRATEAGRRAIA